MSVTEVLNMVLPFVYTLVFVALIWFIVELVFTVRKSRSIIIDTKRKIDPTLEHVENITASLQPVAAKIDPLVERVSLTVDAANLEIMRVDQILEDVGEITETISSAASAVDHAANAPMELVNNVTARVRSVFKPKKASSESVNLGDQKAAATQTAQEAVAPVPSEPSEESEPLEEPAVSYNDEAEQAAPQAAQANEETFHEVSLGTGEAVREAANVDAEKAESRYFTYESTSPWPESIPPSGHQNKTAE